MKSITHNLFSAGFGFFLLSHMGVPSFSGLLLAIWLSLAINTLIDLGHSWRGDTPARSFVTHSIFTAPLWGAMVGYASILASSLALKLEASSALVLAGLVASVMVAYSHLLLDALTQAGVFFGRHRIAIAHFSYNNIGLNLLFTMLGIILLAFPFL